MFRTRSLVALLLIGLVAAAGFAGPGDTRAQTDEAGRAIEAALVTLGGVAKAQCRPPVMAGTPCVERTADAAAQRSLPRGIARFSVTFAEEPGSYVAFFGRTPAGAWHYWFATQEQLSPLVTLPGDLLACTGIDGGPARLFVGTESRPLERLTRMLAEEFVLTQPGRPGTDTTSQEPGFGWYWVSVPATGWVSERDVTEALNDTCAVHDQQYPRQGAGGGSGAAMSLTGTVWTWQRTTLANGDVIQPGDPSRYTVEFLANGRLAGQADCNRANGRYTVTGSGIDIGPLAVTRAACPPGSLSNEFVRQLEDAVAYNFENGDLLLAIKDDGGTMRFAR